MLTQFIAKRYNLTVANTVNFRDFGHMKQKVKKHRINTGNMHGWDKMASAIEGKKKKKWRIRVSIPVPLAC